ncbi:CatB-related O-acetyltransferase [Cyclobacterium qasimii]|nr:CatB-related O-acetyltransferase [Cyclobacterium qasimii]EPR69959.1 Chloramphenicol acetyltransferase [Cyclobacterium qasimii M12-11B]
MVILRDTKVQDYSYIGHSSNFLRTNIGKFCSISRNVNCGLPSHPTHFISTSPIFFSPNNSTGTNWVKGDKLYDDLPSPINIGNDVWIGMNVSITSGINIGDGAVIAAHSVVTKDVPPYSIVGGVPAKILKYRFSSDIINQLQKSEWWNKPDQYLKDNLSNFQHNIDHLDDMKIS